jgi:hypothetical protein
MFSQAINHVITPRPLRHSILVENAIILTQIVKFYKPF